MSLHDTLEGNNQCIPLLRCRKITQLTLIGPCGCQQWTPRIQAYYMELCSMPELEELSLRDMFEFPIHLLQKATSLRTLSFVARVPGLTGLKPSKSLGLTGHGAVKKTVFLRKLKVDDGSSMEFFLRQVLSPASCVDIKSLHALEVQELGASISQYRLESLQDALHPCNKSLTSFKIGNIEGESDFGHLRISLTDARR